MGEYALPTAVNNRSAEQSEPVSHVKAVVSLVLVFGLFIVAWAITFPPIFYHLFNK